MNKKLICDALDMIDEKYIEECIVRQDAVLASERNMMIKNNRFSAGTTKKIIAIAAAACLLLTAAITASASGFWGIGELLERSGVELPQQAEEYIQPQIDSAQSEEWSCRVTETLCDGSKLLVSVEITCGEEYILVATDASPSDSAASCGIDWDGTLDEYAASRSAELLYVNAGMTDREIFGSGFIHFERLSDTQMVILVQADVDSQTVPEQAVCTVYAEGAAVSSPRMELELSIAAAPAVSQTVFVPVEPEAVPGLRVGSATVTQTVMGCTVVAEETVTDDEAFSLMEMTCVELPGLFGGHICGSDGAWQLQLEGGQCHVPETLTIRVLNVETGEVMGDIVFVQK